jgi:hypothetical protein
MDYFRVSIVGSDAVYEEVGEAVRFTDEFGVTVPTPPAPIAYQSRGWEHPSWAEPLPVVQGPRRLSKLDYMNRFHDDELAAIYGAAKVVVQIEIWLAKFNATSVEPDGTSIDLDDLRTAGGIHALEAAGLIGAGRAAEILNA